MKLIGIADSFSDNRDGEAGIQQKTLGFLDPEIGQVFQRRHACVPPEQPCQIRGMEAQLGCHQADVDVFHIVLVQIADRQLNIFLSGHVVSFVFGKLIQFREPCSGSAQQIVERLLADGFEQIIERPITQSFPGIFKIGISGQDDGENVRILLEDLSRQVKSVHHRHPDICDHQLDIMLSEHVQRFFTILCFTDHFKVFVLQIPDAAEKRLAHIVFIIYEQYLVVLDLFFTH